MRLKALCAFGIVAVGIAVFTGPTARAQAVAKTVLENAHVRVIEIMAAPGDVIEGRLATGVLVSLDSARLEIADDSGARSWDDLHAGEIRWRMHPEDERWRVAAGTAHFILTEIKAATASPSPATPPLAPDHSSLVDPLQHHMVLENPWVRVLDGFASAGAESAPHTHPPSVLISLSKSRFHVTIEGRTRVFDFEPTMVRWTNHFEHQWRILAGDARVIMIEVHSAHDDPAFRRR